MVVCSVVADSSRWPASHQVCTVDVRRPLQQQHRKQRTPAGAWHPRPKLQHETAACMQAPRMHACTRPAIGPSFAPGCAAAARARRASPNAAAAPAAHWEQRSTDVRLPMLLLRLLPCCCCATHEDEALRNRAPPSSSCSACTPRLNCRGPTACMQGVCGRRAWAAARRAYLWLLVERSLRLFLRSWPSRRRPGAGRRGAAWPLRMRPSCPWPLRRSLWPRHPEAMASMRVTAHLRWLPSKSAEALQASICEGSCAGLCVLAETRNFDIFIFFEFDPLTASTPQQRSFVDKVAAPCGLHLLRRTPCCALQRASCAGVRGGGRGCVLLLRPCGR